MNIKFFQLNGLWMFTDVSGVEHGYPLGNMYYAINGDKLSIRNIQDQAWLFRGVEVTEIQKSDTPGDNYVSLVDFLNTNNEYFQQDGGQGGGSVMNGAVVIFYEEFVGTGAQTQFQLTGNIKNAFFQAGVWEAANILQLGQANVVGTNLNTIYDGTNFLTRNRIDVNTISAAGLVDLTYAPRDTITFRVYYAYQLQAGDQLVGYYRDDIVTKQEAEIRLTPAETKLSYESNPDTNAFTDAEKAKLATTLSEWSEVQILHVGKHGNDSNDGTAINKAFLTFGAAIAKAVTLNPSSSNRIAIYCHDAATYTENLTIPEWVGVLAHAIRLVGNHIIADEALLNVYRLEASSGVAVSKNAGAGKAVVHCPRIILTNAANGIECNAGEIDVECETADVENGILIGGNSAGQISGNIQEIEITGTGYAVRQNSTGKIRVMSNSIEDDGNGTAVYINASAEVTITALEINTNTVWAVPAAGAVLYINCPKRTGATSQTGLVNDLNLPSSYPAVAKNVSYTMNPINESLILTYQTTNDITITIPESSSMPNDGKVRECLIYDLGGTGKVFIETSGTDTFQNGATRLQLTRAGDFFRFGIAYPNLGQGIATLNSKSVHERLRYNTTWAAANFATATPVPFNTVDLETDPNILEQDGVNPSRLNIKTTGVHELGFSLAVDSTGGATYNVNAYLRVNGSTIIPGTNIITGNYGGEDQSMSIASIDYVLNAGDYVELVLDHTNLTGNANNIVLTAKTKL